MTRDRPKNRIDPSSGYPTKDDLLWQHEYALDMLTQFKDRMGEDLFCQHGIGIVNKYHSGIKPIETNEEFLDLMNRCAKMVKGCFDAHGKEIENEQSKKLKLEIVVDDECIDDHGV